jgi:hypothetical protein
MTTVAVGSFLDTSSNQTARLMALLVIPFQIRMTAIMAPVEKYGIFSNGELIFF